jgi:hypothetical protein
VSLAQSEFLNGLLTSSGEQKHGRTPLSTVGFKSEKISLLNAALATDATSTMRDSTRWHIPGLIVLSTFWESLFLFKGSNLLDEGWALYTGMQLAMGRQLYADISWVFPPGHALPAWLGYLLDPAGVLIPRLIYAFFAVILVVALYQLGRKVMPAHYALLGAAILAIAAPRSHMMHLLYGYRYMVLAVWVLMLYSSYLETGRLKQMFLAGMVGGVCLYFRVTPALAVSLAIAIAVLTHPGGPRAWFPAWLLYAAGLLLVIVPVLIYFATTVGLARVFDEVILHPMGMLQPLPVPLMFWPDWSSRESIAEAWRVFSLRLFVFLYAGYAIKLTLEFIRSRRNGTPYESTLLVAIVVWGAVFFLRSFGRADEAHMDTTLPPICLLVAHATSRGFAKLAPHVKALRESSMASPLTAAAVFVAWVLLIASDTYPLPHRFARTGLPYKVTSGVDLIQANTKPGDIVLDLSSAPMFHSLSGRPGPGRADILMPGTFVDEADERDFIARLEAAPPTAILWPLHPFDHMESRSIQEIAPRVVAWVEARYRPDQETAKFRLWLPRRRL